MDGFFTFLAITFWVGVIVSNGVYRSRSGLGFWSGRLRILGPTGVGMEWLVVTMGKMLAWPIVLGVWLATGRPEPRILFNDKALAREQASAPGQPQAA